MFHVTIACFVGIMHEPLLHNEPVPLDFLPLPVGALSKPSSLGLQRRCKVAPAWASLLSASLHFIFPPLRLDRLRALKIV